MITAPLGFTRLDPVQRAFYENTGSVPGAAKLSTIGHQVFVRLGPPRYSDTITRRPDLAAEAAGQGNVLIWYKSEYLDGWYRARSEHASNRTLAGQSLAFIDGWNDQRAARQKWHTTHCLDHGRCGL